MNPVIESRDHLVAALEVDLIGPFEEGEVLHLPPSRWYLTGFLAAMDARQLIAEPDEDDELAAGSDADPKKPGRPRQAPRSGISCQLPSGFRCFCRPPAPDRMTFSPSPPRTSAWH